jgi:hypothetical protein
MCGGFGRLDGGRRGDRRDVRSGVNWPNRRVNVGNGRADRRALARRRARKLDDRPWLRRVSGRRDLRRRRRRQRRRGRQLRNSNRWWRRRDQVGHRRLARRGWRWRLERRQEEQGVEVSLLVGEQADPELHVGHRVRRHAARADGRHRLALGHGRALADQERAEMQQRDRIAVGRLDRDRQPVRGDAADERDGSRGWREHGASEWPLEVDAAVLPRRERVVRGKGEALQHGPGHRPRPGAGRGG